MDVFGSKIRAIAATNQSVDLTFPIASPMLYHSSTLPLQLTNIVMSDNSSISVYKRQKNGRWYVIYSSTENGEQQTVERSLGTENEDIAELKRQRKEEAIAEGTLDPFAEMKRRNVALTDAYEFFVNHLDRKGRADSTIKTYKGIVRRLTKHVGDVPLVDVPAEEVESFCRDVNLAQATRHKRYRHIRAFFNFCKREDLLQSAPTDEFEVSEPTKKMPKSVSEEQLGRLCNAIKADYHAKMSSRGGMNHSGELLWRIPIFKFAFYTGLRRSELSRLRWNHLDLEDDLIYIYEQKNQREQAIPLLDPAKKVVEELKEDMGEDPDPEAFVFNSPRGNPYSRNHEEWGNNLSNAFSKYAEKAELPDHLTLHGLRHGFCTFLAKKGVDPIKLQKLARHTDFSTTQQYIDLANNDLRDAGNAAFNS